MANTFQDNSTSGSCSMRSAFPCAAVFRSRLLTGLRVTRTKGPDRSPGLIPTPPIARQNGILGDHSPEVRIWEISTWQTIVTVAGCWLTSRH